MNMMFAQLDPSNLPVPHQFGDFKPWLVGLTAIVLALVAGRFVQAFRNGAGLIDAFKSVIFGTNLPKDIAQLNKDIKSSNDASAQDAPKP